MAIAGGRDGAEVLVLQGRPIGEPVAQYGPFVMNDRGGHRAGVRRLPAHAFGGWPWRKRRPRVRSWRSRSDPPPLARGEDGAVAAEVQPAGGRAGEVVLAAGHEGPAVDDADA